MTKTKINSSTSENIENLSIYLKDLYFVEGILKDELGGESYSVTYDGYKYDSLKEMLKEKPTKQEIQFNVTKPYISVDINKDGVRLYSGESNFETEGVIGKLKSHFTGIRNAKDKTIDVLDKFATFVGGALIAMPFILLIAGNRDVNLLITLFSFAFILNVLFVYMSVKRKSNIFYTDRRKPFFARHKDAIILGLIFAFVGAVLGSVTTKIIGQ
jgi:hypothetical protein